METPDRQYRPPFIISVPKILLRREGGGPRARDKARKGLENPFTFARNLKPFFYFGKFSEMWFFREGEKPRVGSWCSAGFMMRVCCTEK